MTVQEKLLSLQDKEYKEFHSRLMPTVNPDSIIGIRIPVLRRLAKDGCDREFLKELPHRYYEENKLHAFMIAGLPWEECIVEINRFLPHVDNWATCDSLRPECFKNNTDKLLGEIDTWLKPKGTEPLSVSEGNFRP